MLDPALLVVLWLASAPEQPTPPRPPTTSAVAMRTARAPVAGSLEPVLREAASAALSSPALCEEIRRNGRDQKAAQEKLDQERTELARERTRLEQLVIGIEKSRLLLRAEIAQLDRSAKAPGHVLPWNEALPGAEPGNGPVDVTARAVRAMKPEQAAVLLGRLDRRLATAVLRRMRPADAGAVLDRLPRELAAELVTSMASGPKEDKR